MAVSLGGRKNVFIIVVFITVYYSVFSDDEKDLVTYAYDKIYLFEVPINEISTHSYVATCISCRFSVLRIIDSVHGRISDRFIVKT